MRSNRDFTNNSLQMELFNLIRKLNKILLDYGLSDGDKLFQIHLENHRSKNKISKMYQEYFASNIFILQEVRDISLEIQYFNFRKFKLSKHHFACLN